VSDVSQFLMVGELGLDGSVRSIPGMLPVAILAREKNIPNLILPAANAAEAAVVEGVNVYPVSSLLDVLELLNSQLLGTIQREPRAPKALYPTICQGGLASSFPCLELISSTQRRVRSIHIPLRPIGVPLYILKTRCSSTGPSVSTGR
jgi:hypothetical protein